MGIGDECLREGRTACRTRPATIPAPSSKRAVESGAMTPTRPIRCSRRRNAMRPATATARASTSTQIGTPLRHPAWPRPTARGLAGAVHRRSRASSFPAEEVVILKQGANYGWPYCYYDAEQKKLVLAPEYGGDGGKKVGRLRQARPAGRGVSRSLGAERSQDLQGLAVP